LLTAVIGFLTAECSFKGLALAYLLNIAYMILVTGGTGLLGTHLILHYIICICQCALYRTEIPATIKDKAEW
jgi:hypothetical protein